MPFSNLFQTLLSTAEAYLTLGYSLIPLYGDRDLSRPKVAAVPWSAYQQAKPSLDQCQDWFLNHQFAGLGIVTGTISRLAVLDFDTQDSFRDFQSHFPALTETSIVQTRRGYHIYFRLPPNLRLASRKGGGVDLLAEGSYVVARPTVIDGHAYKLIRGGQPALLDLDAIHQIHSFLDERKPSPVTRHQLPVSSFQSAEIHAIDSSHFASSSLSTQHSVLSTSFSSLLPLYRYRISQGEGRNQALFITGLTARDNGWTLEQTLAILAPAHSDQKSYVAHTPESDFIRQREAFNTIRSVYSRPPRPKLIRVVMNAGLPNTVREFLFQSKQTGVVRLWEGLRLKGIRPGQIFTADQAITLLKGIVGRDSIYQALNALDGAGEALFECFSPSGHPKASNDAAAVQKTGTTKKMHFGRAQKPGINKKGRRTRQFVMPDPLDWCAKLGLKTATSDPLSIDDLSTAKETRKAVHREFIKRRPGTYPRRFLAHRLGVTLGSIDTYNDEIPIFYREQFIETRLCWSNLDIIPDDFTLDGVFLEDGSGKRYPALRPLAAKLLRQGKTLTYKRQDANYYWYGEGGEKEREVLSTEYRVLSERQKTVQSTEFSVQREEIVGTWPIASANILIQDVAVGTRTISSVYSPEKIDAPVERQTDTFTTTQNMPTPYIAPVQQTLPTMHTPTKPVIAQKTKPKREPSGRRRLKDEALENLAGRIYERVNRRCADSALHISMAVSRKLVSRYDRACIEKTLRLLETRRDIAKPAGFFVTVLRSESKRFP